MLLAAVVLELFGGILFVFNSSIGAVMLVRCLCADSRLHNPGVRPA